MIKKYIKKKKLCYFRIFLKIIINNIKFVRKVFLEYINFKILFLNLFLFGFINFSFGRCYYFFFYNFF